MGGLIEDVRSSSLESTPRFWDSSVGTAAVKFNFLETAVSIVPVNLII